MKAKKDRFMKNGVFCLEYDKETLRDMVLELQDKNDALKDNWNKLKEYIEKDYDFYDKLNVKEYVCVLGALSRIKDKMQKLERSDSNE